MVVTIHQPEHLPWLGFVDKIRQCDLFVFLDCVQYEKNYFQNRNRVRTGAGATWVTVPVMTAGAFGQTVRDARIADDRPWRRKICQTIAQGYRRAPFVAEYLSELETIYGRPWRFLADLNIAIIQWVAQAFGLARRFVRASQLAVAGRRSELLARICVAVGAKVYLSGVSGRDYLDERPFAEAGIAVRYQSFNHPVYRQCYEPFLANMSSIDLLFTQGPASLEILTNANSDARIIHE